jgi:hypothetical protein
MFPSGGKISPVGAIESASETKTNQNLFTIPFPPIYFVSSGRFQLIRPQRPAARVSDNYLISSGRNSVHA